MKRLHQTLTAVVLMAIVSPAIGATGAADTITVDAAYVRQAPPSARTTGAFMTIRNGGDKAVRVVKAENSASKVTELHSHVNADGVMKMREVKSIEIKAKGTTVLEPGGLHVMLIDLKAPLKEGDSVPITLTFEDGSHKLVTATVKKPMAAMAPMAPMMDHSGHKH